MVWNNIPQILLTTFFTSINFRLKNTRKYSILLNWHLLKFFILWNIYRCDIEFLVCNVYIGNTIYYTYKVWTCIVYDWKHLEAITNQDGGWKQRGDEDARHRRYFVGVQARKLSAKLRLYHRSQRKGAPSTWKPPGFQ